MASNKIDLSDIPEEKLLDLRICDLPLSIEDTWIKDCVEKLYSELNAKGIGFVPSCYLSDEWLTPDGEPVVGIPFFLAHPSLMKLENKMMLEVEGGTKDWCMKLLRHETGHAINYAYKLYKRRRWKHVFGHFYQEYADTYKFRPYSRNFVRHLEDYYAQYHPDEDFAETFAVWLTPDTDWKTGYRGWKALRKLKYVDELMEDIKDKEPFVKKGKEYWKASSLKTRVKNYYKKKKHYHAEGFPEFHDTNLKKIFKEKSEEDAKLLPAFHLLRSYRREIIRNVSTWTGGKKYVIDELVRALLKRSKELHLVTPESESLAVLKVSVYLTTLVMNYIYTGRLRGKK